MQRYEKKGNGDKMLFLLFWELLLVISKNNRQ